jgi:hypothetical protein
MAGRSRSLSCWAPGGQAVLKPVGEGKATWPHGLAGSLVSRPLTCPQTERARPAPGMLECCQLLLPFLVLVVCGYEVWCDV